LLIAAVLTARSWKLGARRIALGCAVVAAIGAFLVAVGPGRPLLDRGVYTVESTLLRSKDTSTSQRSAELQNFGRNVNGSEWLTGRGVGVFWKAEVPAPIDAASFGSKETPLYRIGWHVYGLDWLYKFGLLGAAMLLAAAWALGRRALRPYRIGGPEPRWLIYSLGACAPPLVLLALSDPRVALVAGITVGLLSRGCDFAGEDRAEGRQPEPFALVSR
jgi:hypothetical protein